MSQKPIFALGRGIQSTISPPIPAVYKWAASYRATIERPLLDMSQGSPASPPPDSLLDALAEAARDPINCRYGPVTGDNALRQAAVDEIKHVYGPEADVNVEDVAVTAGCNMAFTAAIMALADAGDEVIVPLPWYFNHQMTLTMLGITPIALLTQESDGFFTICRTLCAAHHFSYQGHCAGDSKQSGLFPNFHPPTLADIVLTLALFDRSCNVQYIRTQTGAIYPPETIASIALVAHAAGIALILDETYRDYCTFSPPHNLFFSGPSSSHTRTQALLPPGWAWRSTIIHLFSFSKSYHLPGHRLGLLLASPDVVQHAATALDCLQICAPRAVQCALAPLLPSLRPFVQSTGVRLVERHRLFAALIPRELGWKLGTQGGYYAFVRHPWRDVPASNVCKRLATELGVLSLPAGFFGVDESTEEGCWVRFSVANVDEVKIRQVCERLKEAQELFSDWKSSDTVIENPSVQVTGD